MKLLIITKHLFDLTDAQSQQSFSLINALMEKDGVRLDVITAFTCVADAEFVKNRMGKNVNIYSFPACWVKPGGGLFTKVSRKLKRNLLSIFPSRWVKSAASHAEFLLQSSDYAAVLSIGLPIESHMVAYRSGVANVWIASFSDPWPESIMPKPYSDFSIPIIGRWQKKVVADILRKSDALVFTCEESTELFLDNFDLEREKCSVIQHVAPGRVGSNGASRKGSEVVVTYSGALSRERVCIEFVEAISNLPINSKLVFKFIGRVHADAIALFERFGVCDRVKIYGWLQKDEALSLMQSSDYLLSVEAKMDTYPFLPSKIADYSSTGVPIFSITGVNSPTAKLLRQYRAGIISLHDKDEILAKLCNMEATAGKDSSSLLYSYFEASYVSALYFQLIESFRNEAIFKDAPPSP